MPKIKTTMKILARATLPGIIVSMTFGLSHSSAQSALPSEIMGAWIGGSSNLAGQRLVVRRGELILIEEKTATHGRLIPAGENDFRYVIDFVDGAPAGRVEKVQLRLSGGRLIFTRGASEPRGFARFFPAKKETPVMRKGFSFTVPQGWISNVELVSRMTGEKPDKYDTDQLVHYYETGIPKPTEDMTVRLLDQPLEKVRKDLVRKLSNPALISRRSELKVGSRKGYVFENSTILGKQRIVAKVYILSFDRRKTLVLAAPTLLPAFPFDLDRACRSVLGSVK